MQPEREARAPEDFGAGASPRRRVLERSLVYRALWLFSPVQTKLRPPSRPIHTGTLCGEPSLIKVARCAAQSLSGDCWP